MAQRDNVLINKLFTSARNTILDLDINNLCISQRKNIWLKLAALLSYEEVLKNHQSSGGDQMTIGQKGKADVTQGQYAAILNNGTYLPEEMPDTMSVEIKAAIQNGKAIGVTVNTNPVDKKIISKIDSAVRQIQFNPTSEKLDFTTTTF